MQEKSLLILLHEGLPANLAKVIDDPRILIFAVGEVYPSQADFDGLLHPQFQTVIDNLISYISRQSRPWALFNKINETLRAGCWDQSLSASLLRFGEASGITDYDLPSHHALYEVRLVFNRSVVQRYSESFYQGSAKTAYDQYIGSLIKKLYDQQIEGGVPSEEALFAARNEFRSSISQPLENSGYFSFALKHYAMIDEPNSPDVPKIDLL